MTLVRWQPLRKIDTLERQSNRLFDEMLLPTWRDSDKFSFAPAAELSETDEAIDLKLEIPGVDAKDLDVKVTKDAVSISGERSEESKTADNGKTRSEFRYGKFQRIIALPAKVQNDRITAEYKDGILRLTLPKAEEEKNKVVKVNLS